MNHTSHVEAFLDYLEGKPNEHDCHLDHDCPSFFGHVLQVFNFPVEAGNDDNVDQKKSQYTDHLNDLIHHWRDTILHALFSSIHKKVWYKSRAAIDACQGYSHNNSVLFFDADFFDADVLFFVKD